jgi:sugar phosphate isomerase/epimerase
MLALSTCWRSDRLSDGEALVKALNGFDVSRVELEYRIHHQTYAQMGPCLRECGLTVGSVHNFFPIPPIRPKAEGSGDFFLLSSPDKEERRLAVEWTQKSLEHASDLEARAVVLHCGRVDMEAEIDRLHRFYETGQMESEEAQVFLRRKLKEREKSKGPHFDSLLLSLDRLMNAAEQLGVVLALENRYHYHQLPALHEFEVIFQEFHGGPVGYWHDTGHAHANEVLGVVPKGELLKRYAAKLIGVHLHDARGLEDHQGPGTGDIDFDSLKEHLKDDTLRVIELESRVSEEQVREGIQFLREKGIG